MARLCRAPEACGAAFGVGGGPLSGAQAVATVHRRGHVGMINISHFAEFDGEGPDAAELLEYICVATAGGDTPVGKGIYTHFLDAKGGVRADLTVLRLGQDHYRVIDGADAGHRDLTWIRRLAQDRGANVNVTDTTTQYG
ncbi:MAG: hypothetical protein LH632_09620, partial [Rhodoferax sp.]|nr:hypothetical protein [Rhodoferax sp.]